MGFALSDRAPKLPKLREQHQKWLDYYVGEAKFNATKAAAMAGYKHPQASGFEVHHRSDVQANLAYVLADSAVSRDEILRLVGEDARRTEKEVIQEITHVASEIVQSSLASSLLTARTTARTNLMKAHGMFTENIAVSGSLRREFVIVDGDDE